MLGFTLQDYYVSYPFNLFTKSKKYLPLTISFLDFLLIFIPLFFISKKAAKRVLPFLTNDIHVILNNNCKV